MRLFREWCLTPMGRCGRMLPLATIAAFERAPDAGYAGVYMFDEACAQEITSSASSAGLARYPVYSDSLTLDLDQGSEQLVRTKARLDAQGLGYSVYESGGKGYHVVVALRELVHGTNVPYSQRKWAEMQDVGADLSLYQAGHIVSLPGRRHPKTGKRKQLTEIVEGQTLALPLVEVPAKPTFNMLLGSETGQLEQGLWFVLNLLQKEPGIGGRHQALWQAAKILAEAGLAYDTALDILMGVNATWDDAKTDQEVDAAVAQAYR